MLRRACGSGPKKSTSHHNSAAHPTESMPCSKPRPHSSSCHCASHCSQISHGVFSASGKVTALGKYVHAFPGHHPVVTGMSFSTTGPQPSSIHPSYRRFAYMKCCMHKTQRAVKGLAVSFFGGERARAAQQKSTNLTSHQTRYLCAKVARRMAHLAELKDDSAGSEGW